jgi:hypothetical protein
MAEFAEMAIFPTTKTSLAKQLPAKRLARIQQSTRRDEWGVEGFMVDFI